MKVKDAGKQIVDGSANVQQFQGGAEPEQDSEPFQQAWRPANNAIAMLADGGKLLGGGSMDALLQQQGEHAQGGDSAERDEGAIKNHHTQVLRQLDVAEDVGRHCDQHGADYDPYPEDENSIRFGLPSFGRKMRTPEQKYQNHDQGQIDQHPYASQVNGGNRPP